MGLSTQEDLQRDHMADHRGGSRFGTWLSTGAWFTRGTRIDESKREPWPDTARFFAATLIVVGHFLDPLFRFDGVWEFYAATWGIRLPVFAMLAGYFSSLGPLTWAKCRTQVERVGAVYLFFMLGLWLFYGIIRDNWYLDLGNPTGPAWFLLALFLWRLVLPFVSVIRWLPLWALLAAVAAGYMESFGFEFAASRTITFFPFFLTGVYIRRVPEFKAFLRAPRVRLAALVVFVVAFALLWRNADLLDPRMLGMDKTYINSGFPEWTAGLQRLSLILGALGLSLSFLSIMPRRRVLFLSFLGTGSMYIYVLHTFPMVWVRQQDLYAHITEHWQVLVLGLVAVVLAAVLASPPVRAVFWPVIQPRLGWILRVPDTSRWPRHRAVTDDHPTSRRGTT